MGLLTDKVYATIAALGFMCSALVLAEQEISLRHELAVVNKSLDSEIQCRVGSTCADKLAAVADAGNALVVEERTKAAAAAAAAAAARDKQAADAVQQQQAAIAQVQKEALTWKQKYTKALTSPDCATWAKQAVSCSVH